MGPPWLDRKGPICLVSHDIYLLPVWDTVISTILLKRKRVQFPPEDQRVLRTPVSSTGDMALRLLPGSHLPTESIAWKPEKSSPTIQLSGHTRPVSFSRQRAIKFDQRERRRRIHFTSSTESYTTCRNRHAYRRNPTHFQLESVQPANDDERPLTLEKCHPWNSSCHQISSKESVPSSSLLCSRSSPVECRHGSREEHLSHTFSFDDREDDATCTLHRIFS